MAPKSFIVPERGPGPELKKSNCHIQQHPKSSKLPRHLKTAGLVSVAQLLFTMSLQQLSCKAVHTKLMLYEGSVWEGV